MDETNDTNKNIKSESEREKNKDRYNLNSRDRDRNNLSPTSNWKPNRTYEPNLFRRLQSDVKAVVNFFYHPAS